MTGAGETSEYFEAPAVRGGRLIIIAAWLVVAGIAAAQDLAHGGPVSGQPVFEEAVFEEVVFEEVVAGEPVSDEVVRDTEFGVTARHFGLERRVLMYQWRKDGDNYARAWSELPIDSAGFGPGHDNPGFPVRSERWIAAISIDGKPLQADAVERLGEWRTFRPNFSSLPANLTATFQPEGDGLGSAENPLDPQVGDLRVSWRELALPPLAGRVVLQDGRWVLAPQSQEAEAVPQENIGRGYGMPIGIGLLVVLLALAVHHRQHRRKQGRH